MKKNFLLSLLILTGCSSSKLPFENPDLKVDTLEARFIFASFTLPVTCLHKYNNYKVNDSCWVNGVTWEITRDTVQLHEEIKGNREKMIITNLKIK